MIIPIRKIILQDKVCARCKKKAELDWAEEPLDAKGLLEDARTGKIDNKIMLCQRCRLAKEINKVKSG